MSWEGINGPWPQCQRPRGKERQTEMWEELKHAGFGLFIGFVDNKKYRLPPNLRTKDNANITWILPFWVGLHLEVLNTPWSNWGTIWWALSSASSPLVFTFSAKGDWLICNSLPVKICLSQLLSKFYFKLAPQILYFCTLSFCVLPVLNFPSACLYYLSYHYCC